MNHAFVITLVYASFDFCAFSKLRHLTRSSRCRTCFVRNGIHAMPTSAAVHTVSTIDEAGR